MNEIVLLSTLCQLKSLAGHTDIVSQ